MPGERIATGSIVLQSGGGARQQADSQADTQAAASELERIVQFEELNILPPSILAPGHTVPSNTGAALATGISATSILESLTQNPPGTGMGNHTGEATVQMFGVNGKGSKFIYVLDRSESMSGRRLQMAKEELIRSVNSLGNHHQFNIIFYSGEWRLWQTGSGRRLPFATETEKQDAIQFINSITASGGTHHYRPLLEAIAHRPDVIFLLTDGESHDDLSPDQLDVIERTNSRFGQGAQINVIQFGGGGLTESPSRALQELARQNNGGYQYVNTMVGK
jgi:hypothetical protein